MSNQHSAINLRISHLLDSMSNGHPVFHVIDYMGKKGARSLVASLNERILESTLYTLQVTSLDNFYYFILRTNII